MVRGTGIAFAATLAMAPALGGAQEAADQSATPAPPPPKWMVSCSNQLDFDKLVPALNQAGVPHDWWCVDLCFWPNAWDVTADSKRFLDKLRKKFVG